MIKSAVVISDHAAEGTAGLYDKVTLYVVVRREPLYDPANYGQ